MSIHQFKLVTLTDARRVLASKDKSAESYADRIRATRLLSIPVVSLQERAELEAWNEMRDNQRFGGD